MLSPAQIRSFKTFGFLAQPRAMIDDVVWITGEFERVWIERPDVVHDGSERTMFPGWFAAQRPRLTELYAHPAVVALADGLLGEGWSVIGGDGNFYSGDTGWHPDYGPAEEQLAKSTLRHLKIAFYLDPTTRDSGALRVLPGSHQHGDLFSGSIRETVQALPGREVPSVTLETMPGDLLAFDHRLWHASFGGGKRRRMFTLNLIAPCRTTEEREAALWYMRYMRDSHGAQWEFDERWISSMSPSCRQHLEQTLRLADIVCHSSNVRTMA